MFINMTAFIRFQVVNNRYIRVTTVVRELIKHGGNGYLAIDSDYNTGDLVSNARFGTMTQLANGILSILWDGDTVETDYTFDSYMFGGI